MATQLKQAPVGSPAWAVEMVETAKDHPRMEVCDLSPTLAKFLLDVNQNNRAVRNIKVTQYAADMAAGNWLLNGEPIIISADGNLNDGQHRCLAVIESNTTIPATFIFGIARETRLTVDQGASRSAGDFLGMEGVQNANILAAIGRMVIAYDRSDGKNLNQSGAVTSSEIRSRVDQDAALVEAAKFGNTNGHYSTKFAAGSLIGFAFYILSRSHKTDAQEWLERVCRGDGLKMKDPAHTLREKLLAEGKMPRDRKATLIFKAWNFHRRGMKINSGSLNKDLPFPAIL